MPAKRSPTVCRTFTLFRMPRAVHIARMPVALLLAAALLAPAQATAQSTKTLTGRLASLVTDPQDERDSSVTVHFLLQDDGSSVRVDMSAMVASVFTTNASSRGDDCAWRASTRAYRPPPALDSKRPCASAGWNCSTGPPRR